jgi:hypothetical protein
VVGSIRWQVILEKNWLRHVSRARWSNDDVKDQEVTALSWAALGAPALLAPCPWATPTSHGGMGLIMQVLRRMPGSICQGWRTWWCGDKGTLERARGHVSSCFPCIFILERSMTDGCDATLLYFCAASSLNFLLAQGRTRGRDQA